MTTKYFEPFGFVRYKFGDGEAPVLFNDLTEYVDIIDEVKENATLLNKYTVVAGERPDTLSYELYGTTDYYWTFFLLNDHVRVSGWAQPDYELLSLAKSKYPHRVLTTESTGLATDFPLGSFVRGRSSGTVGQVIQRRLDFGQLVVKITSTNDADGDTYIGTERITRTASDGSVYEATLIGEVAQHNAVHHYETGGEYVDIDPFDQPDLSGGSINPITYLDRLTQRNDELKEINVLKPDVIASVVSEFNRLHEERI